MNGLKNRNAIVCASSRGLGRACAFELAREGACVVVNGRDAERVEATRQEIVQETGAEVITVVADIGTPEGQDALFEACPEPDVLVNNNGGPPRKDFLELSRDDIYHGVTMNMVTPIELLQRSITGMRERGFGRIINITSINVRMPVKYLEVSAAARSGLSTFMASIAREVAGANVTINNILPGFFDTDRQKKAFQALSEIAGRPVDELRQERLAGIPAERFGEPKELGRLCAFLCSSDAGYITNQNILIDGGRFEGGL